MSVVLDLSFTVCIWISAAVAITYTLLGGLYSVAYTDVVQLILIFAGLWICVPFVLMNPHTGDIGQTMLNNTLHAPWIGQPEPKKTWQLIDLYLLFACGSLSFQSFHQRTLAASSSATAKITCFSAAFVYLLFGIPPILLGAAVSSTDWNQTSYGSPSPYERGEAALIFAHRPAAPHPFLHLHCRYRMCGRRRDVIGRLRFAVCSFRFQQQLLQENPPASASDREIMWVIRASVMGAGVISTSLTFIASSVVFFWFLGNEIAYVVMFPQLVCILYFNISNGYGAVAGLLVGVLFRLLSGEPSFSLPPVIHFPGCTLEDGVYVQYAPVRTICMLASFAAILLFSYLTSVLFSRNLLPQKWDVL
ncbi:unnamed protein product, partial [Tetraodon nigroviridis]